MFVTLPSLSALVVPGRTMSARWAVSVSNISFTTTKTPGLLIAFLIRLEFAFDTALFSPTIIATLIKPLSISLNS